MLGLVLLAGFFCFTGGNELFISLEMCIGSQQRRSYCTCVNGFEVETPPACTGLKSFPRWRKVPAERQTRKGSSDGLDLSRTKKFASSAFFYATYKKRSCERLRMPFCGRSSRTQVSSTRRIVYFTPECLVCVSIILEISHSRPHDTTIGWANTLLCLLMVSAAGAA